MDTGDVIPKPRLNFITCSAWVPAGAAKGNPDKVEISKEDLARIINETAGEVEELENEETENGEDEEMDEEGGGESSKEKPRHISRKNDDSVDFEGKYVMEKYEEEEGEESMNKLLHLGKMTIHASNDDDPLVSVKDQDDVDSDDENHEIIKTDNLIAIGHVEGDAAILEVHVYNVEQHCQYVHHDIFLPAVPLCMEWLNYDPGDEQLKPGNMVAIGSMSPVVEVWDLDLVDCLEPAYKLGRKGKKKKKIQGVGHKDAVLCLAWNTYAEHVLASGSVDETVILWDLQHGTVAQQLMPFKDKVQSLKWHHTEAHSLLTGSCDKMVRLFDCNDSDSCKSWKLDGEIECVRWDKHSTQPYNCLASTDQGSVYYIDCRQDKPLWKLDAHTESCSGIEMSPQCPGCLVTVSTDKYMKVWDIAGDEPKLIKEQLARVGVIHSLSTCSDKPFVFCIGGDNRSSNLKVLDIRQSKRVRMAFCERVGLPTDEDEDGSEDEEKAKIARKESSSNSIFAGNSFNQDRSQVVLLNDSSESGAKPKKRLKKKGPHVATKRNMR